MPEVKPIRKVVGFISVLAFWARKYYNKPHPTGGAFPSLSLSGGVKPHEHFHRVVTF